VASKAENRFLLGAVGTPGGIRSDPSSRTIMSDDALPQVTDGAPDRNHHGKELATVAA
jgi:hypothetical protein